MDVIRIGLIGAGFVAQGRQLPAFKTIPDVTLQAVWSRNPLNAAKAAAEFGFRETADDWREIAQSPDVDAVVISTPPVLHLPATLAALEAGKHVLCQARMARNLKESQEMARAAQASDLVTALYPPRPGLKGDRVMKRLIHEETYLGPDILDVRVAGIEGNHVGGVSKYHWRTDPEVSGVNAMRMGLWAEVLHRWVGTATSVVATGKPHMPLRPTVKDKWADAVIPDSLAISAQMECGATASFHFSAISVQPPELAIEIYGSEGTLIYDLSTDEIRGTREPGSSVTLIDIPPEEIRAHDTDSEFVNAIRGGESVSPDFEEGLRYMEFSEAVAQSVMTGSAVAVPPEPKMDSWGRTLE